MSRVIFQGPTKATKPKTLLRETDLHQLMDPRTFYDDIAAVYHHAYDDWPSSARRQADLSPRNRPGASRRSSGSALEAGRFRMHLRRSAPA